MINSTADAEQYSSRSANHSTKGSRKGFGLLGGGESVLSHLSLEEQRDSIKQRLQQLQSLRAAGFKTTSSGYEIRDLMEKLRSLRPRIKSERANEIPSLFMDICREQMPPLQFKLIMDEANRRQRGGVTIEAVKRQLQEP